MRATVVLLFSVAGSAVSPATGLTVAIDAADPAWALAPAIDGTARGVAPDIGAHER